jgi:arginyl-tRNA synthetase
MNMLAELRARFAAALSTLIPDPGPFAGIVRPAQDAKFGDIQANCAMPLAKQLGQPRDENPLTAYALYDTETRRAAIKRVPYDIEAEVERIAAAGLPPVLGERLRLGV